jgi:hypothetical protein
MESEKSNLINSRNVFLGEFVKIKYYMENGDEKIKVKDRTNFILSIKRILGFKNS